jgi:hypothetical protein
MKALCSSETSANCHHLHHILPKDVAALRTSDVTDAAICLVSKNFVCLAIHYIAFAYSLRQATSIAI